MTLYVPAAVADVLDRLTILAIKLEYVSEARRASVAAEHDGLLSAWLAASFPMPGEVPEYIALDEVNRALWAVEDRLRAAEARGDFGPGFVEDARSVYRLNDRRAAVKRAINERYGSTLREEKVYAG